MILKFEIDGNGTSRTMLKLVANHSLSAEFFSDNHYLVV
jgi:hypothetical protein